MSKEKIREILSDFWCERITIDTALTEINKIVRECVPQKLLFRDSYDRGYNKAIAKFKANWEGK